MKVNPVIGHVMQRAIVVQGSEEEHSLRRNATDSVLQCTSDITPEDMPPDKHTHKLATLFQTE